MLRGLQILRAFTPADQSLGNLELAERTGLAKATISRLTHTLVGLGYLNYDHSLGRHSIGPATIALGYSGLSASAVISVARPLMQILSDQTNLTVSMGIKEGMDMMYVAYCRSQSPVMLRVTVGARLHMWRSAMGLAYIAGMNEVDREDLVEKLLRAEPQNSERIQTLISGALERYGRDGFVVSYGEWYSFINAVGVPFMPTDGSQLVAITCGGTTEIATKESCETTLGPSLRQFAVDLQNGLSGQPTQPALFPKGD
ncbi:IclR family transcriptional regulator [Mesorhizobium sp. B3-1-3]|nr:IclR family transcriptional regulator [Mesorhizobium sp. B3-1-8]TPI70602.1 IclR family transcriptional regulator [Mesorhizobium sp. B3-1-3]